MKMESVQRVKEEIQDLGHLHVTLIKEQVKSSSSRLKHGLPLLFLGITLSIFGIARLFDGLAIRLMDEGSGAAQFLSGGLLLLLSITMFTVAVASLKHIKQYAGEVSREIREDITWLKNLL